MANIIKNVAERVIYRDGGATTEEILGEVVPDLFDNDLFFDAASKNIGDILAILESDFDLDENNLWQIRAERQVGNFIPPRERIRYYVIGYLRKVGKASFDSIVTTILPLLINGHQPTREDIADVLNEVAISYDSINWELKDPSVLAKQGILPFSLLRRVQNIKFLLALPITSISIALPYFARRRDLSLTLASRREMTPCWQRLNH